MTTIPSSNAWRSSPAPTEPVSRAFISAHADSGPQAVVDLGCGPGFSTLLLAEGTGGSRDELLDLQRGLETIATGATGGELSWVVRQVALPAGG